MRYALDNWRIIYFNIFLTFQTSEETDETIAQTAIDMWMDDGCQILAATTKSSVVNDVNKSDKTKVISSNAKPDYIEPSFPMTTLIKIGPLEDLE